MPIVIKALGTAAGAFTNTIGVPFPAGVASGDLLIASLGNYASHTGVWNTPAGWTALTASPNTGNRSFWKIATGAESGNETFTYSGATTSVRGSMISVTGHDPTTPIAAHTQPDLQTSSIVFPSITAASNDTGLVQFMHGGNAQTYTPPAGTTKVFEDTVQAVGIQTVAAGATGTRTWTVSAANPAVPVMLAVNPVPSSTVAIASRSTYGRGFTGSALPVPSPSGVENGDLLVAFFGHANADTITPPAGWTSLFVSATQTAFWRLADGTQGSTFNFTRSTEASSTYVVAMRITGHNPASPIHQSSNVRNGGGSPSLVLPSVTTTQTTTLIQLALSNNGNVGTVTWTPPVGTVEVFDDFHSGGQGFQYAAGVQESVGAGTTGTRTWTASTNDASTGMMLAVVPSVAVSTTPGRVTVTYRANNTFTVPAGVTKLKVRCLSSGAGAGNGSSTARGGGGGAGAEAWNDELVVTPGSTHAVVVGQGVAALTAGQVSSFGAGPLVRAGAPTAGSNGGIGAGAGGTGGTKAASIPTTNTATAGSTAGGNGVNGGNGGSAPGTYGGAGGTQGADIHGKEAGGGGGGGGLLNGPGGTSARGVVIVEFEYASDAVSANDSRQLIVNFKRAVNDSAPATDSPTKRVLKNPTDSATASDASFRRVVMSKADAVAAADALTKIAKKNLSEVATATDSRTISVGYKRAFADTAAVTDALSKTTRLSKTDIAAVADAINKNTKKTFAEGATAVDQRTILASYMRAFTDSVTVVDSFSKKIGLNFADNISGSAPAPSVGGRRLFVVTGD